MPCFVRVEWRSNEPTQTDCGLDRRRRESRIAPETARLRRSLACKSFEAQPVVDATARARSSQQKIDYSLMLPGII